MQQSEFITKYKSQYKDVTDMDTEILLEFLTERQYVGESLEYVLMTIIKKHKYRRGPTYEEYVSYINESGISTGKSDDQALSNKWKDYQLPQILSTLSKLRKRIEDGSVLKTEEIDFLYYYGDLMTEHNIMKENGCGDIMQRMDFCKREIDAGRHYKWYASKSKWVPEVELKNLNKTKRTNPEYFHD